jgi:uroporphyrinogen-III synthase
VQIIVTRPWVQAIDWVRQLQANRIEAAALPLIAIEPATDTAALVVAWNGLAAQRLVIFVSPNACEQFFVQRPPSIAWPAGVYAASPGPGTTRTLIGVGVPAEQIIEPASDAAQFDSESLWAQLSKRDWRDASVLILRGDTGRDWLADTLRAHGARVSHLAAYRRAVPVLDEAQGRLLRAAIESPASHLWLFSSSEAIDNLAVLARALSGVDVDVDVDVDWSRSLAIGTHPRITASIRRAGFGEVRDARPSLEAVIACIQSFGP